MFKHFFLNLIRIYQKTLSFDHSWLRHFHSQPQCKFHPTCSEYTYQAVSKYGITVGIIKGLKRLIRCHPWSLGGHDPVK